MRTKIKLAFEGMLNRKYQVVAFVLLLFVFFIFQNCGSTVPQAIILNQTTTTPTPAPTGTPSPAGDIGVISVPKPGNLGMSPQLSYNGIRYSIGSRTSPVSTYLNDLMGFTSGVSPVSQDNFQATYNIQFTGTFSTGRCPLNPTSQCPLVNLQSLVAF